MATVRDLIRVTQRAITAYKEVRELELRYGAKPHAAELIAQTSAMRLAEREMLQLLEVDSCDSSPGC